MEYSGLEEPARDQYNVVVQRRVPSSKVNENDLSVSRDAESERRRLIDETLRDILCSEHFRKSKRYPAFLEYIVDHTLQGDEDSLKERIVGAEVFGRSIDYDTNSDPCVRVAAGEVRRRIALYYSANPNAPVRIELPLGSYSAEFYFPEVPKQEDILAAAEDPEVTTATNEPPVPNTSGDVQDSTHTAPGWIWRKKNLVTLVVSLGAVLITAAGVYGRYRYERAHYSFWAPVMGDVRVAPLIVVAASPGANTVTRPLDDAAETNAESGTRGTLDINIAAGHICGVFGKFNRTCDIIPAHSATLQEIHDRSVILVGNLDSSWTIRLAAPLRYRLADSSTAQQQGASAAIMDTFQKQNPSVWTADTKDDANGIRHDYAVVARFHGDTTGSYIVMFAGLDNLSTHTVTTLAATPGKLGAIVRMAPKGWTGDNLEAVIQVDVLRGYPETSRVVAVYFW
jgi:hypothetical protein